MVKNQYISYFILLSFIGLIIYIFHPFFKNKRLEKFLCDKNEYFENLNFNGVLNEKYRDSTSHLNRTLIINNTKTDLSKNRIIIGYGRDFFYDEVNIGDSIFKPQGTLEVLVYRKNSSVVDTFNLHFGCEE